MPGQLATGWTPTLRSYTLGDQVQFITDFAIHGLQVGYGSGRPVRGSTVASTLHGIRLFFLAANMAFPSDNTQIRMLLKGINRLDQPATHKVPVSLQMLESCFDALDLSNPSDQALWGVLCLSIFFLLRRSEIASNKTRFSWFALNAEDIVVLNHQGVATTRAHEASAVHIRLRGSKTNQRGVPTLRMLNRSGHRFLCPVFGALCIIRARRGLSMKIPAAVFINGNGFPECVSSSAISRAIRQAATRLGNNLRIFSPHSLRAGGATHMYRAGVDTLTIQFHGRWASTTFKQYTRLCKESVQVLSARIVSGSRHMHRLQ